MKLHAPSLTSWSVGNTIQRAPTTLGSRCAHMNSVTSIDNSAEPLTVPMYVVLGRTDQPVQGFTWRIWASRTSFYLKSRAAGLEHLKFSLHSDDPRHPAGGGYKMAMDTEEAFERAVQEGQIAAERYGEWPVRFSGKPLSSDATLVMRMRWTWDAATRLGPAPAPGDLKKGAVGLAVPPPPEPGDAMDVDLIVSKTAPFWYQEKKARRDNACLGPLRNEAGDWLTGTVVKRSVNRFPTPASAVGPKPIGKADEIRAVGSAVDADGVLWLVEQRMSKSKLGSLGESEE